jgi:GntR family transcriptional regulator
MELFPSASDPRPMYQQIVDQITAKVMAGDWPAGQALPSIRELAAASGVSVITVRRAYEELERAGVIATRQGKGSVVAEGRDLPTALMHVELQRQLAGLLAIATRLGLGRADLHRLIDDVAAARAIASETAGTSPATAHPANPKGHTP